MQSVELESEESKAFACTFVVAGRTSPFLPQVRATRPEDRNGIALP
jgi:hypothetical protein